MDSQLRVITMLLSQRCGRRVRGPLVGEVASIPNGSSCNLGAKLPRTQRGPNLHEDGQTNTVGPVREVDPLRVIVAWAVRRRSFSKCLGSRNRLRDASVPASSEGKPPRRNPTALRQSQEHSDRGSLTELRIGFANAAYCPVWEAREQYEANVSPTSTGLGRATVETPKTVTPPGCICEIGRVEGKPA